MESDEAKIRFWSWKLHVVGEEAPAGICGNAALAGAERILHDRDFEKEASELAKRAETVNLGGNAAFQDFYMEQMMFEE